MVLPPRSGGPAILLFHAQSNLMFSVPVARCRRLCAAMGKEEEEPANTEMKKNIEIVPNIQKLFGIRDENLQVMEERAERHH